MKRSIAAAVFAIALIWPANVAAAAPSWDLTGAYTMLMDCTGGCIATGIRHSVTITSSDRVTGAVVGSGVGPSIPEYTMTGTVSGSDVSLEINWAVAEMTRYNPLVLTGTVDATGGMSGTAIDHEANTFNWWTTAGAAVAITAPAATITAPASPTNAASLSYAVPFSESVSGLAASDFSVTGTATGCVVGNPSGSGSSYTVALTGCSGGTVILALAANSVSDTAGDPGPVAAVTAATVIIDRTAPAATITAPASPTNAASLSYAVPFSESVSGLAASDFSVTGTATGCVVGNPSGSGSSYTVALTGCSGGTVILALAANSVSDGLNTGPVAAVTAATVIIDRTAPAATITAPASPTNAASLSYAVPFSESVSGLAASDFSVTGTATGCVVGNPSGSGSSYTVALTGCSGGTVILALAANSVSDGLNPGPVAAVTAATVIIDRTAPAATITAPASPTNAASLSYAVPFSESVSGLAASDFSVTGTATGCVVGNPSGSGSSYTVALTGCSGGTVILALAANSVSDTAGDPGPVAAVTAATVIIDRTAPAATITAPASPTNAASLSYAVPFSESVSGLAASDFSVTGTATGCVVGNPSGSGSSYTVALTGCSGGTVILALAANSVSDGLNTGPVAAVTAATVIIDRTAPAASSLAAKPSTGAVLSGTSIPLLLTWSARDNVGGSQLARYELAQSRNGAAWKTVSTSLRSPSVTVAAASSGTVRYRVRAVDAAGNIGAWANGTTLSPRLVQQSRSSVKYSGTWTKRLWSSFSGGSIKYTKAAGRSASYKFTGRSIALVTTKAPSRGKVRVYVNGKYVSTVDLYRSSTQYRVLAWQKTWSTSRTRTVKLVVVGTSDRPRVDLDAFAIVK